MRALRDPRLDTDPTLGGILGDGIARIRSLVCKTTRSYHSDPEGVVDERPTVHDEIEISFELQDNPGSWLPVWAHLSQSHYDGVYASIDSVSCTAGSHDISLPASCGKEKYINMSPWSPKAIMQGGLAATFEGETNIRSLLLGSVFSLCKQGGSDLKSHAPAGSERVFEAPGEQSLQLCEPGALRYVSWAQAFIHSVRPSLNYFSERVGVTELLSQRTPEAALGVIYRCAERLESWQIAGLIERGLPTRWHYRVEIAPPVVHHGYDSRNDDGYDPDDDQQPLTRKEFGGLMHEAVSWDSDFELAQPWRLLALADLVDPAETDSRGLTAQGVVHDQMARLLLTSLRATGRDETLSALQGAASFFEACAIAAELVPSREQPQASSSVRL